MVNKIREKDSDRDSLDKRHRKTSSSNSNDAPPIKILKEDIYAVRCFKLKFLKIIMKFVVFFFFIYKTKQKTAGY